MRTMYDGIASDAATIRAAFPDAALVAYYIDGGYAWSAPDTALFPHAVRVQIAVFASTSAGDVIDCETGDATPEQAAAWVRARKAAGYWRPTIYCSLDTVPAVRQATGDLVLARDYDIWVADYDDTVAPAYPLCAAKQYRDTAGWDVSAVYDDGWPHRTEAPSPAPARPAAVWPAGIVLREGDTGGAVIVLQRALHDSGEYGARGLQPIDGIFGPGTLMAVRNFQNDRHLTVDGIAGPVTRQALGI